MCLDGLEELVKASQAAQRAVDDLKGWESFRDSDGGEFRITAYNITAEEIRTILKQRVADTEAALRALGFTPPPKRVNEGDAAAELVARGVTLPGTLPAQSGSVE